MIRHAIFVVKALVPESELDEDDGFVEGVYGVSMGDEPGCHPMVPRNLEPDPEDVPLEEAAKDVFHDKIGIAVLDDFSIDLVVLDEGSPMPEEWGGEQIGWI